MSYKTSKRILDVVFSSMLLIILSPLLLIVSLLVWITDGNEIFVKEPLRLGVKGKEFRMYKFRSMIPNAHDAIQNNPEYEDVKNTWLENDGKLRISEDRRITWIGKILRKTDMDEFPQLINVLKGEMSVVGPRPMYIGEVNRYIVRHTGGKKYIKRIQRVRPGITGLWQVSGRNEIKFKDRVIMEAKYASHINLIDDVKIFLRTPLVVLTRKGVYE